MSGCEGEGGITSAEKEVKTPQTAGDKTDATDVGVIRHNVEAVTVTDNAKVTEPVAPPGDREREPTPTRKAKRLSQEVTSDPAMTSDTGVTSDKTEEQSVLDKISGAAKTTGSWGWGGLSSLGTSVLSTGTSVLQKGSSALNTGINTASSSVQSFADTVGEGLHVVFDPIDDLMEDPSLVDTENTQSKSKARTPEMDPVSGVGTDGAEGGSTVTEQPHSGPGETDAASGASGGTVDEAELDDTRWFPGWSSVGVITNAMKKTVKDTTEVFKEQGKTLVSGSKSLAHGTLDVLESIGKKTYDVIAEGDHGIKQTIKKSKEKANLSQLLREAKERAERDAKEEAEFVETRKAHFGTQFDEFQGLVQLEALEMLSNQCEGRVQGMISSLRAPQLDAVKKDLIVVKHAFTLEERNDDDDEDKDHEFDRLLTEYIGQVGLNTTPERLIHVQEKCRKYLMDLHQDIEDEHERTPKEVHEAAIQSLAEFTARCIEHYHRVGQLILLDKATPLTAYKNKATNLASATRVLCTEVGIFSNKFTQCMGTMANKSEDPSAINPMITNVYLEASNSSTYVQDAFLLLLPVVQQGVIEAHQRAAQEDS